MLRLGKVLMVIAVMAVVFSLSAFAQAPHTLMYQGKLTDANLDPIAVATSVTFTIWDLQDPATGVELWSEIQDVTPDAQGVFTIELGAITPFTAGLFDGSVRFLSMTVAAEELLPRQPITSVPYAMNSVGFANEYVNYVDVGTSAAALMALNIRVPGPGYVALELTADYYLYKDVNESSWGYASIDSTGGYIDYWVYIYISNNYYWATGGYYTPVSVSRVFATDTAGTYTFYVNGYRYSGANACTLYRANFKGVYYPNNAGTGTPLPGSALPGATAAPPIPPEELESRQQGNVGQQ